MIRDLSLQKQKRGLATYLSLVLKVLSTRDTLDPKALRAETDVEGGCRTMYFGMSKALL